MHTLIAWLFPRRILRYGFKWTQSCCLICGQFNLQGSPCPCEWSYLPRPEARTLAAPGAPIKRGGTILAGIAPR
jgi:hypothetical protein